NHDSSAAPQTAQIASPVCGTKNFSSVRLYSAPQLHRTMVAIPEICARNRPFSSPELCHNQTDPLPMGCRQPFCGQLAIVNRLPQQKSPGTASRGFLDSQVSRDQYFAMTGPPKR